MDLIRKETEALVQKGVLTELTWDQAEREPGHYSQMFTVPKKDSKKRRAVINLKGFNDFVSKKKFRMETVKDVKSVLKPGMWGATVDMTDAYYHIGLHQDSRKYVRFMIDGKIYQFTALPMGLTSSPRIFTKLTSFLTKLFRRSGMVIVIYLDDILVLGDSKEECKQKVDEVVSTLERLGFLINRSKSVTEPSQIVLYLGLLWDLSKWEVKLSRRRVQSLRTMAQKLRRQQTASHRQVARMLGLVQSSTTVVPIARARIRQVQWEKEASFKENSGWDEEMLLSTEAKQELKFWEELDENVSLPISWSEATQYLETDASDNNLGWYFDGVLFSDKADNEEHINVKELRALDRALDRIGDQLRPGSLQWNVDNNTALWAIVNQGSNKNWIINGLAVDIWHKALDRGVHIVPRRLTSEGNYLADGASRNVQIADWHLNPKIARKIFSLMGHPDVDLMASERSRQVPAFFSWSKEDTSAIGLNSLAADVDWGRWELPYVFPPFPLISRTLEKMRIQRVREAIIVVPWWPSKPHHPVLLKMITQIRRIPMTKTVITDLISGNPPQNWKTCVLVVCRISGRIGTGETSVPRRDSSYNNLGERTHKDSMSQVGNVGHCSVMNKKWTELPCL